MYYSVWRSFNTIFLRLDRKPTSWADRLTLFVAYLIQNNRQSSTVKSYISAIKAVLQDDKYELHENQYLLSSLTRACKLKNDRVCTRLPIHKGMLTLLLLEVEKVYFHHHNQPYLSLLYKTLLITAYFGLFQVGELTWTQSNHAVKAKDVQIGHNKDKFLFILRTSKTHNEGTRPQLIKISRSDVKRKSSEKWKPSKLRMPCPYKLLRKYSDSRPPYRSSSDQFFVFTDGSPVPATNLRCCLKFMLKSANFNNTFYSMHSLRSGRAGDMLKLDLSVETIKKLGRWRSNAVFKYLKY